MTVFALTEAAEATIKRPERSTGVSLGSACEQRTGTGRVNTENPN